jgi:hypothetical protein
MSRNSGFLSTGRWCNSIPAPHDKWRCSRPRPRCCRRRTIPDLHGARPHRRPVTRSHNRRDHSRRNNCNRIQARMYRCTHLHRRRCTVDTGCTGRDCTVSGLEGCYTADSQGSPCCRAAGRSRYHTLRGTRRYHRRIQEGDVPRHTLRLASLGSRSSPLPARRIARARCSSQTCRTPVGT